MWLIAFGLNALSFAHFKWASLTTSMHTYKAIAFALGIVPFLICSLFFSRLFRWDSPESLWIVHKPAGELINTSQRSRFNGSLCFFIHIINIVAVYICINIVTLTEAHGTYPPRKWIVFCISNGMLFSPAYLSHYMDYLHMFILVFISENVWIV